MIQGQHRFTRMDNVIYGKPASDAIAEESARRGAERVFIVGSKSLSENTDEIARVEQALGERHVGTYVGMPSHSPRNAVIDCAQQAADARSDLLVTFGGGSVTDATKVVQICLKHKVFTVEGLDGYHAFIDANGKSTVPQFEGPDVRQISVPTTLSGGEFNPLGGCTDHRRKVKQSYTHPDLIPVSVILDPAPTVHTPEWLWLSTGMRAVDHCVEGLCSQYLNPYAEGALLHGLKLLTKGLAAVKANPGDLDARLQCQIGAWMSMTGNIPKGLSHAIGHILGGTCNVPHGYTSCVMLPAALAWNESVNADRQAVVAEAMGRPGERASDVMADFIAGLGLPRSLGAVEVGEDQFDLIAKNTMHDRWTHTNPRKVAGPEDIKEVLRLAV